MKIRLIILFLSTMVISNHVFAVIPKVNLLFENGNNRQGISITTENITRIQESGQNLLMESIDLDRAQSAVIKLRLEKSQDCWCNISATATLACPSSAGCVVNWSGILVTSNKLCSIAGADVKSDFNFKITPNKCAASQPKKL